jgi:hypothetical protein
MAWTWCINSHARVPVTHQGQYLRELRDGYGHVGPEVLLHAMIASQTKEAERETAMLADPGLPAARRRHAKAAIEWATADQALVRQHQETLLSALRA